MRCRSFIALLLLLSVTAGQAQSYCSVRTFGIRDGLAANNISGMGQSPNGLMWFSTWNGLCCYDGYQFTTFRSDSWEGIGTLSTNHISMIHPDSQNNVWVRTYDGGLYLLDTRQCRFVDVGRRVEQKFGATLHPRHFYAMPDGCTLITDEHGKLNLRADDRFPADVEHMERVTQATVDAVRPPHNHNARQDTALAWRLSVSGLEVKGSAKHHIDRQGNLWLTSERGLTLANFHSYPMRLVPTIENQQTRSVLCRRNGTIWAGTNNGYIAVYSNAGKLMGWIDGQGRLTEARTCFADRIYTMMEDSHGLIWVGTKGMGLYVIDTQTAKVHHYMPDTNNRHALSHAYVYDIDEDSQGNIWVGTYGGGLNLAQRKPDNTWAFLHAPDDLKDYPMERYSRIRRITHDSQGNVLLSCTDGLVTFNGRERRFYHTTHSRQDTTMLRTSEVMQALVTRAGDVYVTTLGGGIQRVVGKSLLQNDLHFQSVRPLNRVTGNALSMTEDMQGRIWITRETEVCVYDPSTERLEQYGPNSVAGNLILTEAEPAVDSDGNLWAGALDGVLVLSIKTIQKSSFSPNIIFTGLHYQGEQEAQPILNRTSLTIPPDKRNFTLSLAALDYGDNYLMEYAFRMDDEKEWSYIGNTPRISFSQLPAGKHTLVVKSTNCEGVWCDNEAILLLNVTPLWWERFWVRMLLLLLTIALSTWILLSWQRRRQRAKAREQRLESILRQYRDLQQQVEGTHHEYQLEEPQIVDADQQMMQRLMKFIEQHIGDEDLKIDDMAQAVGLGRTAFYEKTKALVGVSPIDFLRQLRMQRAKELLCRSSMNISEVAYAVGFSDPKYFSRCFKKDTGLSPREYREKKQ